MSLNKSRKIRGTTLQVPSPSKEARNACKKTQDPARLVKIPWKFLNDHRIPGPVPRGLGKKTTTLDFFRTLLISEKKFEGRLFRLQS